MALASSHIAQAEVMPRLSLCPLVELSSAVLSNPGPNSFLHCSNNFEFRIQLSDEPIKALDFTGELRGTLREA